MLADTLGSVGVIVSSVLIYHFDWMIADPVCSMFISVLIMMSVYPLMRESLGVLMQRTPVSLDHTLQASLQKVYELEGVVQLQDIHVWTLCSGVYHGSLRVEVLAGTDHRRLLIAARSILIQAGIENVVVEINHLD